MMQSDNDDDGGDDGAGDVPMFNYSLDTSEQMDEHMAALVLTSLSCSPASPAYMPGICPVTHLEVCYIVNIMQGISILLPLAVHYAGCRSYVALVKVCLQMVCTAAANVV